MNLTVVPLPGDGFNWQCPPKSAIRRLMLGRPLPGSASRPGGFDRDGISAGSKPLPLSAIDDFKLRVATGDGNLDLGGAGMFQDIGKRLAHGQEQMMPHLG